MGSSRTVGRDRPRARCAACPGRRPHAARRVAVPPTRQPVVRGRARAARARCERSGRRPPAHRGPAKRHSSPRPLLAPRAGARARRAEPGRARRSRRVGRRHDEPRGGGARRPGVHDVCGPAGRGRQCPGERRETAGPDLRERARAREARGSSARIDRDPAVLLDLMFSALER